MKIVADENIPCLQDFFADIGNVVTLPGRSITPQIVRDADILLVRSVTPVNESLLAGSRVGFVGTTTIGLDHIDEDFLARRQIGFSSAPGSNARAVVDYVLSALAWLRCYRGVDWFRRCIGIVGMGNTGGALADCLLGLGVECVCCDPPLARAGQGGLVELEELLERADVISLHTPLVRSGPDATVHMFGARRLSRLRPGTALINSARGEIIDNGALLRALGEGSEIIALLDVWEGEPAIDLQLLERVAVGTPHIAGYSLDGKLAGVRQVYRAVCEHFGLSAMPAEQQALLEQRILPITSGLAGASDICNYCSQVLLQAFDIQAESTLFKTRLQANRGAPGAAFDRLRKEYPVRRECTATRLDFSGAQPPDGLVRALGALGFRV